MLVGYVRSSTVEQIAGYEAQVKELGSLGCDKIFGEKVSSVAHREQLNKAIEYVREGDTLVVKTLSRLARNITHLWEIIETLEAKGVALRILDVGIDTKSSTGKLVLTIFGAVNQWEREVMLERQREGIAKAKAEGKYKGRKPTARAKSKEVIQMKQGGASVKDIVAKLGVSQASVYRILQAS